MSAPDLSILTHYLAPFRAWLAAEDVTELVVNRPGEIGLEAAGGWRWIDAPHIDTAWLTRLAIGAAAYTRQDVSDAHPICSTVLPGGERCQIVLPPAAEHPSLTIRKPSHRTLAIADLHRDGLFAKVASGPRRLTDTDRTLLALRDAADWPGFFQAAVAGRRNILVSGATGSGKTTFAKGLIRFIPADERILTLEDTRELVVPQRNAVHLIYSKDDQGRARVGAKQLLESALRMRPDRILLQELRDESAFSYLRTANSGHPGSITTIHADSTELAFEQLILLAKESPAGRSLSREDILALLHRLVDVVVQMSRQGGRRHVTEVWYEPLRQRTLAA